MIVPKRGPCDALFVEVETGDEMSCYENGRSKQ
jgi:hypothetical protein